MHAERSTKVGRRSSAFHDTAQHQESDEISECSESHTKANRREASGTGKPQEVRPYRRPYISTRQHNKHQPLHGNYPQEKVCSIG